MGLLLVISAAAAARCHDKREQLPNDCACMLHVYTLTRYVGLGCQKGGLAKTGLGGRVPPPLEEMVGKLTDRNHELE